MNTFGQITTHECVNTAPPPDPRCQDPAFAVANPDICSATAAQRLVVKPGFSLGCSLGSVQFHAYLVTNGGEVDVTTECIWASSDTDIALVGVLSGNATGIATGTASISATYNTYSDAAELTVMAGTCSGGGGGGGGTGGYCDLTHVGMMLLVDTSRSMSQTFPGYGTRLRFAKSAAAQFAGEVNTEKDTVGLISFNDGGYLLKEVLTSDADAVATSASALAQTQQKTGFYNALAKAIEQLDSSGVDLKVLVIFSDGEDTSAAAQAGYIDTDNPLSLLADFKDNGGVVICMGCRASGGGFALLSAFSTGGFFVNGYVGTEAVSLTYMSGLKGYICAGNCVPAGDEMIHEGSLNYDDFINWNVTGGHVDLIGNGFFDYLPGNDLYVDLTGTYTTLGRMVSKVPITLTAGDMYRLSVKMAGVQVQPGTPRSSKVQVFYLNGTDEIVIISQLITLAYTQPFTDFAYNFVAPAGVDAYISIEQQPYTQLGSQNHGMLLGSVKLDNATTLVNGLIDDDFSDENPVFVPPACGQSTLYPAYVGYNCYGVGCLDEPPPEQIPDPDALPDIESGSPPPAKVYYNVATTACAQCDSGNVNLDSVTVDEADALIPVMTGYSAPSGTASASAETGGDYGGLAWNALDGLTSTDWAATITVALGEPAWVAYEFGIPTTVAAYKFSTLFYTLKAYYSDFSLQGSNNGTNWNTIDTQTYDSLEVGVGTMIFGLPFPVTYKQYRLRITPNAAAPGFYVYITLNSFQLYSKAGGIVGPSQVCKTTPKDTFSADTQKKADDAAYAAALALANAELNCTPSWTRSESVTLPWPTPTACPNPTGFGTYTSYVSDQDAIDKATASATAEAQAVIDGGCNISNNTQAGTLNDATPGGVGLCSPFPYVQTIEDAGTINHITVSVFGFAHTWPQDIEMFLEGPDGTCVGLMNRRGGSFSIASPGVDLVFEDGGAAVPNTLIASGTYAPTDATLNPGTWAFSALLTPTAPLPPSGFSLAAFNSLNQAGAWKLWIIDVGQGNTGTISGGFLVTIT